MVNRLCIIVPTLNSFEQLSKLVKELKDQTQETSWRVIFVDGNSCKEHKEYLNQVTSGDSRFEVIDQSKRAKGIFGAMNDGWEKTEESEWAVFWGSDDWPANNNCIEKIIDTINTRDAQRALLAVFSGKYVDSNDRQIRTAKFIHETGSRFITADAFNTYIRKGLTPPHQATVFSSKLRGRRYKDELSICADLDLFLRLSSREDANIIHINEDIITMQNGGISNQMTIKRLSEVAKTYQKELGIKWVNTMLRRYINRMITRIEYCQRDKT